MQLCFGVEPGDDDYAKCVRIFDYNEDGVIDLRDYETLEDLLSNGAS
jgi:hypothetical protein